jgi:hypothetical protein
LRLMIASLIIIGMEHTNTGDAVSAETDVQLRAVCPRCFRQQAIRGDRMVAHGYTRPEHWHANVGMCDGRGRPHFGTDAGREYARSVVVMLREQAQDNAVLVSAVLAEGSEVPVFLPVRAKGARLSILTRIENPSAAQRRQYADNLRGEAVHCTTTAEYFEEAVASWVPAEPIAVVRPRSETVVHFRSFRYTGRESGGHKVCARSAAGARAGWAVTTTNPAEVTCPRCTVHPWYLKALAPAEEGTPE